MTHYLVRSIEKRERLKDVARLAKFAARSSTTSNADRGDSARAPAEDVWVELPAHQHISQKRINGKHSSDVTPARTQRGSNGGRGREGPGVSASPNTAVVFDPRYARELSEVPTWIKNGTTQEELNEIERELDNFDWRQW